jgi:hypothetical protein
MTGLAVISSILGSLAGLLALSGEIMQITEKSFITAREKYLSKKRFKKLKIKRKTLKFNARDYPEEETKQPLTSPREKKYLIHKF